PVTFFPISFTAASSSAWRRPVMKTYAPSATNRRAVARPMPLLPPVTTATLPSNLGMRVTSFLAARRIEGTHRISCLVSGSDAHELPRMRQRFDRGCARITLRITFEAGGRRHFKECAPSAVLRAGLGSGESRKTGAEQPDPSETG